MWEWYKESWMRWTQWRWSEWVKQTNKIKKWTSPTLSLSARALTSTTQSPGTSCTTKGFLVQQRWQRCIQPLLCWVWRLVEVSALALKDSVGLVNFSILFLCFIHSLHLHCVHLIQISLYHFHVTVGISYYLRHVLYSRGTSLIAKALCWVALYLLHSYKASGSLVLLLVQLALFHKSATLTGYKPCTLTQPNVPTTL